MPGGRPRLQVRGGRSRYAWLRRPLGAWAAFWSGGGLSAVAWWLLLVSGVGLAVVDWREHRLPTPLVAVAGVGIAGALTANSVCSGDWGSWWQAAAAAVAAFVVFSGVAVVSGLGYGDVKLAAVIAGCAGYTSLSAAAAALVTGFLAAGVAAGVLLVGGAGRGSAMALGRGCCWVPPLPWPTTAERQHLVRAAPPPEVAASMPTDVAAHRRGAGRVRRGRSRR